MHTANDTTLLQDHFNHQFALLVKTQPVSHARFEKTDGMTTTLSGIPYAFLNWVHGVPSKNESSYIEEKINYFKNSKLPFAWFINEGEGENFKYVLNKHGFNNVGVFQGVVGPLSNTINIPKLSPEYSLEQVTDDKELIQFNNIVCASFDINGIAKEMYHDLLKKQFHDDQSNLFHWCVKKEGRVVAGVSTLIQDSMVSFWNGATDITQRKQGLSSAIRRFALQHAIDKGCTVGSSYLMSEGLAFGICTKLGYKPKWRFDVYVAPTH